MKAGDVTFVASALALSVGTLLAAFQAQSTHDALKVATQATAECETLAEEIRLIKKNQIVTLDRVIARDQLFTQVSKSLLVSGLDKSRVPSVTSRDPEALSKSGYVRHASEVDLTQVTNKELLAFLRGVHTDELPLVAESIRFEASDSNGSAGIEERWNVKLLLTYFVRSATSKP